MADSENLAAVSERTSRIKRRRAARFSRLWAKLSTQYLGIGWIVALVLGALLLGLIGGFVWATARDLSTLAMNGREILRLNGEVASLHRQLAVASSDVPQGNWWVWWMALPARHLWEAIKFW